MFNNEDTYDLDDNRRREYTTIQTTFLSVRVVLTKESVVFFVAKH